ncbi:phosphoribosyltransferase [Arthrobacter sp. zg-Y769]|uniref:phosphoribosyltransferase n=1 Tax=Arthrobacter sp. zg-Y769 TaxID=2894191 RepID=UPI001E3AE5D6|nr:phosphoribosyltransferase family protein [Arthrobacter sp. zg-Y769]MCC9204157.1 phosphoribosyltransferase [Arthrobacter sp. zg-Y769]
MFFSASVPSAGWVDRADAGRTLAVGLAGYSGTPGLLILGLPRGGVPVAAVVARALSAPLDVVVVRKIGYPEQPELAAGAVAGIAGTVCVVRNEEVLRYWRSRSPDADARFAAAAEQELAEVRRREEVFRPGTPARPITGGTVIVVDDGLATGATMRAALGAVRQLEPARLVAAAPVACGSAAELLIPPADDVVVPWAHSGLDAVGLAYRRFGQTTDAEVRTLLGV